MATPIRILVVDDSPVIRILLQKTLHNAGYDVMIANNGDEMVRMTKEHLPDLLLVDLMMPVMDGYEAIRQLRNDTRTAHLPMIIVTALAEPTHIVRGFDSDADDVVTKPFDIDILLARIRRHLRRIRQRPVNNPLTGLPGNVLLQNELEHCLRRNHRFALLYVDLDHFKAFNDVYGFSRGDSAIQLVAKVLHEVTAREDFLAHIGGDDFAIIHLGTSTETLCQRAIAAFQEIVPSLYDDIDLQRGYLTALDRQGKLAQFELLSLSIAALEITRHDILSIDALSKKIASLKKRSKQIRGNSYIIDSS